MSGPQYHQSAKVRRESKFGIHFQEAIRNRSALSGYVGQAVVCMAIQNAYSTLRAQYSNACRPVESKQRACLRCR